jgi:4-alpha-glucanotransferase
MPDRRVVFRRRAGILLHPTCLPGPDGIGDLGLDARRWIDWLAGHGQSLWQVLPLGPTTYGDSPYQTLSTFAGNPLLISLDRLCAQGWLTAQDLAERPHLPADRVDFGVVIAWKQRMLDRAWTRLAPGDRAEIEAWATTQSDWLEDFALFMALKEEHDGAPGGRPRRWPPRASAWRTASGRSGSASGSSSCSGRN